MLRKTLLFMGAASLVLGLAACNTVKGAGRDVQSVGQASQDAINGK